MSSTHRIELAGCTPEPLMSYLKALGVLRLVGEQADAEARGRWADDELILDATLSKESITAFFLESYAPTPIIGPWAGGSGFFGSDNRSAVQAISASSGGRLASYRLTILKAQQILADEELSDKPSGEEKARLLRRYRREMPDLFVRWMDAALALGADSEWYAPLLGTGGNDGRLDFTQNFMQRVVELGLNEVRPPRASTILLRSALWGEPVAGLGKAAVGQFSPGRAGGPNATQGMEAGSIDNPWDFLLAPEGSLVLSSAAVRRLGAASAGRAAFPFDRVPSSRGRFWKRRRSGGGSRRVMAAALAPAGIHKGNRVAIYGRARGRWRQTSPRCCRVFASGRGTGNGSRRLSIFQVRTTQAKRESILGRCSGAISSPRRPSQRAGLVIWDRSVARRILRARPRRRAGSIAGRGKANRVSDLSVLEARAERGSTGSPDRIRRRRTGVGCDRRSTSREGHLQARA